MDPNKVSGFDPLESEIDKVAWFPDLITNVTRQGCKDLVKNAFDALSKDRQQNVMRQMERAIHEETLQMAESEFKQFQENLKFKMDNVFQLLFFPSHCNDDKYKEYVFTNVQKAEKELRYWFQATSQKFTCLSCQDIDRKTNCDFTCLKMSSKCWQSHCLSIQSSHGPKELTLDEFYNLNKPIDYVAPEPCEYSKKVGNAGFNGTYTFPYIGAYARFILTEGNQTITGTRTFTIPLADTNLVIDGNQTVNTITIPIATI